MALCGDGAANQGQVFEAYNMAKLWSLPVIFITENNGYGMGTSSDRASASTEYYTRGDYVPGIWVDGMDVLAVREATKFIRQLCLEGKGPFVMEVATYRYHGHSVSDPGTSYRTREEVQEVRQKRDPITSFKVRFKIQFRLSSKSIFILQEKIINAELVANEELKAFDAEIKREVDEAVRIAKADPELDLDELFADVYVNNLEPNIRGITPFTTHKHKNTNTIWNL